MATKAFGIANTSDLTLYTRLLETLRRSSLGRVDYWKK